MGMSVGCEQLAELAPVGGNDEQDAGRCKGRTCDDRSGSPYTKRWDLRCDEPHACNQDEQKRHLGDLCPVAGAIANTRVFRVGKRDRAV